ncbi:MAG TPA: hypothetical protein VJT72_05360 [Pseudonocardiaceae bacterium]|nr:hypothetical protein [Pseudonocardiaceae bacterium]
MRISEIFQLGYDRDRRDRHHGRYHSIFHDHDEHHRRRYRRRHNDGLLLIRIDL